MKANRNSDDTFLASAESSYSYGELEKFGIYLARFISQKSGSSSKPIGIWADSSDLSVLLIAACWQKGIPFICLNPREKSAVLINQIKALQPSLIFSASEQVKQHINQADADIFILDLPAILKDDIKKADTNKTAGVLNMPGSLSEDIFGYFFTSGTTQRPKIVPLKRRQMEVAARASAKNIRPEANQFWLLCMPLHHVGGVSLILRSFIYGSAIYRTKRFDAVVVTSLLAKNARLAAASLVPTMLKRLLKDPSFSTHDQFKGILLGGGPISLQLLKECVKRHIPVIPSFGMTETCAQIAANPITKNTPEDAFKSVGRIFKPNKIQIRNAASSRKAKKKSGAVWLKGPQIFDGYIDETNNKTAFDENGWFNTGDYARLDEKSRLYIEARRTDLIITGGENVSPFEIEAALETWPQVKEAAVFGVSDKEWGQRIIAAIVMEAGQKFSRAEAQKKLNQTLPGFKTPKQFLFVDELPRTSTGKLKRNKLAALLAQ